MTDNPSEPHPSEPTPDLPPSLKLLKAMVMVLTGVMIAGVVTVVVLLVMRLGAQAPALPSEITLPEGHRALAVTQGTGWVAVVTETADGTQSILILDALSGVERQRVVLAQESSN